MKKLLYAAVMALTILSNHSNYALTTYITPDLSHRYKAGYPAYLTNLKNKISIADKLPQFVVRFFGGKHATRAEVRSLDRLFSEDHRSRQKVKEALDQLGTPEDIQDFNIIFTAFKNLPSRQRTKDSLIGLLHPFDVKRLGLQEGASRSSVVNLMRSPAAIADDNYFRGILFSLYILYLYDEKLIRV